jgi:putative transposase
VVLGVVETSNMGSALRANVHCVEQRFGHPGFTQGAMVDRQRLEIRRLSHPRAQLRTSNLARRSKAPESNGMAEAFAKAFKRDYVRVNSIPDARTALLRIDHWMEDCNSEHRNSICSIVASRDDRSRLA